jgi:hypothetical protein
MNKRASLGIVEREITLGVIPVMGMRARSTRQIKIIKLLYK